MFMRSKKSYALVLGSGTIIIDTICQDNFVYLPAYLHTSSCTLYGRVWGGGQLFILGHKDDQQVFTFKWRQIYLHLSGHFQDGILKIALVLVLNAGLKQNLTWLP